MGIRFSSLGSGSEGNALVVEINDSRLMLDCGFGLSETERRLARIGLLPDDLDAIIVTHEHADHIGGVARLSKKYSIPVWMTHGTARQFGIEKLPVALLHIVDPHEHFNVGDISVLPYLVPHDACEPVQYVLSDGAVKLGVLTDTGSSTAHIETVLSGCAALVLECNHDLDMLMSGSYPQSLKKRVAGRYGHLDNGSAAALLKKIDCSKLNHLIAAHLSKQNNRPELAQAALASAVTWDTSAIGVAWQDLGFDWRIV